MVERLMICECRYNPAQRISRQGTAWFMAWPGEAGRGKAWFMAWPGEAGPGEAWHGGAWFKEPLLTEGPNTNYYTKHDDTPDTRHSERTH